MRTAELVYLAGLTLAFSVVTSFTCVVRVVSESMAPTLLVDDRLLVIRRAALTRCFPARGQIVVFTADAAGGSVRRRMVKRVAATGGESISAGADLPADGVVHDAARPRGQGRVGEVGRVDVPAGSVYVLGDNRPVSRDSREYGCIPLRQVTGLVVLVVWPLRRARVLRRSPPS
ncbi:signal peptidase I [Streptomyces sp. NRRL S-87]|uniref:signal peptidase I n=1 Tax=Streptomyces sp. NRRL S-87 TaxID=1463920 RepID=UPI00068F57B0|nr:signal peptidase I [Streptomyces sp. NRRL S-87]